MNERAPPAHRPTLLLSEAPCATPGTHLVRHRGEAHAAQRQVIARVHKDVAVRPQTVAPRAPDLLHVVVQRLGQAEVDDAAHVRLVDAEAKGDRGDHDRRRAREEGGLRLGACQRGAAGVVRRRRHAVRLQVGGNLVDLGLTTPAEEARTRVRRRPGA